MKRLILLIITILVLGIIYSKLNLAVILESFHSLSIFFFTLALLTFLLQFFLISFRWQFIVSKFVRLSLRESFIMYLSTQTLNLFLPSKAGDFAKALFLKRNNVPYSIGLGLVFYEKILDVASLVFIMVLGVLWSCYSKSSFLNSIPQHTFYSIMIFSAISFLAILFVFFFPYEAFAKSKALSVETVSNKFYHKVKSALHNLALANAEIKRIPHFRKQVLFLSILVWISHLVQIYFLFISLHTALPGYVRVDQFLVCVPIAIFIGLLPVTIAGFGTRDLAFVLLFPNFSAPAMTAVAMLVNLRYIIPALLGIPYSQRYFERQRE